MLASERLKNWFERNRAHEPIRYSPWIEVRQDNGALLLICPKGQRFHLIGPCARFVSAVLNEEEYSSLIKKLGRDPSHWPDNMSRPRKLNANNSGVT